MLYSIEDLNQDIYERVCFRLDLDPLDDSSLQVVRNMDPDEVFSTYCESMDWDPDMARDIVYAHQNIIEASQRPE